MTPAHDKRDAARKDELFSWITDKHVELAEQMLGSTLASLDLKGCSDRSDFEQNLYIALKKDHVNRKTAGIVASLVAGWQREVAKVTQAKEDAKKSNEFILEVGERTNLTLTLTYQRSFPGDFGARVLHHFEDDKGNLVVWWGGDYFSDSGASATVADIGDKVSANWTVKKLETYKGRKQTVVTRPAKKEVRV